MIVLSPIEIDLKALITACSLMITLFPTSITPSENILQSVKTLFDPISIFFAFISTCLSFAPDSISMCLDWRLESTTSAD
jgi:hypothetical protein